MIPAAEFVSSLKEKNLRFFSGVPCSFFQSAINCVIADPELRYVMAPNEGSALAIASGAFLAGHVPVVMIQNSGFGNLINPLTSLNMIYRIPALIFMSGRAYGVEDEPQHEVIGRTMKAMLEAMGVRHLDLPSDTPGFEKALDEALAYVREKRQPFFFLVRKGCVGSHDAPVTGRSAFPLKRIDAIRIISESFQEADWVIATTGMPSRELFSVKDRVRNFYMQGSMGHAASIALGISLTQPQTRGIILDGDGAVLMHMGTLSSVGHYKPCNFYHLMLDNEAYETTGNQNTTSPTTDFAAIAKACGYLQSLEASDENGLRESLNQLFSSPGPGFLRVKINRLPETGTPRISSKYSSDQITDRFKSCPVNT